jgi:hypothetical protein
MGDLIQFPNRRKQSQIEKLRMMQDRLAELSVENQYITDDIEYLQNALEANGAEASDILKDFAIISGSKEPIIDLTLENEEPEVDNTTDKWDEIANKTLDASLKILETAVQQLKFDFNKPTNEDK